MFDVFFKGRFFVYRFLFEIFLFKHLHTHARQLQGMDVGLAEMRALEA